MLKLEKWTVFGGDFKVNKIFSFRILAKYIQENKYTRKDANKKRS